MNRKPLPFDTRYFKKLRQVEGTKPVDEVFNHIFENNHWAGNSRSGIGSGDDQTAEIKRLLPGILKQLNVQVFLDLPCGDFNWLSELELGISQYIGGDIVPALVEQNRQKHGRPGRAFHHLNLLTDPLPAADLLFCRDCLVHLSNDDIQKGLANIRNSSITWLMTTTFPDCEANENITTGDWRILNLEKPPFNFPPPCLLLNEKCTEGDGTYADKSLGVWKVADLPFP